MGYQVRSVEEEKQRRMRSGSAKNMALCGVTAALAVVIMCMGGLIPVATYVCPMLCIFVLRITHRQCGDRMAWVWYVVVSILSLLMGPDKEAAGVFAFLGYYPIIKPKLDKKRFPWLWKLALFNCSIVLLYTELLKLFGVTALTEEFSQMGSVMLGVLLALGNVTFILMDKLLAMRFNGRKGQ